MTNNVNNVKEIFVISNMIKILERIDEVFLSFHWIHLARVEFGKVGQERDDIDERILLRIALVFLVFCDNVPSIKFEQSPE